MFMPKEELTTQVAQVNSIEADEIYDLHDELYEYRKNLDMERSEIQHTKWCVISKIRK